MRCAKFCSKQRQQAGAGAELKHPSFHDVLAKVSTFEVSREVQCRLPSSMARVSSRSEHIRFFQNLYRRFGLLDVLGAPRRRIPEPMVIILVLGIKRIGYAN